jgi:hypothetical protein
MTLMHRGIRHTGQVVTAQARESVRLASHCAPPLAAGDVTWRTRLDVPWAVGAAGLHVAAHSDHVDHSEYAQSTRHVSTLHGAHSLASPARGAGRGRVGRHMRDVQDQDGCGRHERASCAPIPSQALPPLTAWVAMSRVREAIPSAVRLWPLQLLGASHVHAAHSPHWQSTGHAPVSQACVPGPGHI